MDKSNDFNLDELFNIPSTSFLNVYDRIKLKEYINGFAGYVPNEKLEELINRIINSLLQSKKLDITRKVVQSAPYMIGILRENPTMTTKQVIDMFIKDGFTLEEISEIAYFVAPLRVCTGATNIIRALNDYDYDEEVVLQNIDYDTQTK